MRLRALWPLIAALLSVGTLADARKRLSAPKSYDCGSDRPAILQAALAFQIDALDWRKLECVIVSVGSGPEDLPDATLVGLRRRYRGLAIVPGDRRKTCSFGPEVHANHASCWSRESANVGVPNYHCGLDVWRKNGRWTARPPGLCE